ncbi:MAG: MarR family winged helix-turn-helix transcriptional regulator [Treponema sp.]|nr:MarR family winged helix-turn-helix transcriptional regulator [Treponema sp.]
MSSSDKQNINKSISKISHIHSLSADFLTERLSEKGLENFASSHGNILFQLSLVDSMRMNELSERINRDKSTTTVLVQKLINKGLVEVKSSETDKRSKLISLSEKGREYNKLTSEISANLIQTFYKGFSEEEKEKFFSLLLRIEENFSSEK